MSDDKQLVLRDAEQVPQTIEERKRATDEIIDMAAYWAKKLMEVVKQSGMSTTMGNDNKQYLEVEGWLVIAEFAQVRAVVDWVRPWLDIDNNVIGYECRVKLIDKDERIVGVGESSCGLDAFPCRKKFGSEKDKAAKSAAQTWAISRALRNKFSYIAKLAGYQAVPAEEMREDPPPSTAEKLITTKSTFKPSTMNGVQLESKILDYCNGDTPQARQILKKISGKVSASGLTAEEVGITYQLFKRDYLDKQPDDDNIPEFEAPK